MRVSRPKPICSQSTLSLPPENIRKPLFFSFCLTFNSPISEQIYVFENLFDQSAYEVRTSSLNVFVF